MCFWMLSVNQSTEMVREFHKIYGLPIREKATLKVSSKEVCLRLDLIEEELAELKHALAVGDIVETADALGDLVYVVEGMALVLGIDLPPVIQEIHRSNLTKLDENGNVIYSPAGKVLKGPHYETPNLKPILGLDN